MVAGVYIVRTQGASTHVKVIPVAPHRRLCSAQTKWVRGMKTVLINAFICAFLYVAWAWTLPQASLLRRFLRPFSRYVAWLGLWHSWNMFAPNPLSATRYLRARIKLANGDCVIWAAPHAGEAGHVRAFLMMRHRKFQLSLQGRYYLPLRAALADYLLRKYNFEENPPVEIRLLSYQQIIPPPGETERARPALSESVVYTREVIPDWI